MGNTRFLNKFELQSQITMNLSVNVKRQVFDINTYVKLSLEQMELVHINSGNCDNKEASSGKF